MGDPICKWRNASVWATKELVAELPKVSLPKSVFNDRMLNSIYGKTFAKTGYQLACQLGLYYINEKDVYIPRFTKDITDEEAESYLNNWAHLYHVPNPYTARKFDHTPSPVNLLGEIAKYLKDNPTNSNISNVCDAIFEEETGNIGCVKYIINNFATEFELDDEGNLALLIDKKYPQVSFDRNDRKAFFELFGNVVEEDKPKEDEWQKFLEKWKKEIEELKLKKADDKIIEAKGRALQSEWKKLLAKEMMYHTKEGNKVFCPFTKIKADFCKEPMLFIASHIKRHSDSDISEKYDINNGLLLIANADALFDKYMITVSENKELLFSCLLDDQKLLEDIKLNHDIFKDVLNDKRMEYLADHRKIFFEKEAVRKDLLSFKEEEEDIEEMDIAPIVPIDITNQKDQSYDIGKTSDTEKIADEVYLITLKYKNVSTLIKKTPCKKILVGCCKDLSHLRWINSHLRYNIRMGNRDGSVGDILYKIPKVDMLVTYLSSDLKRTSVFDIVSRSNMTGKELNDEGYPNAKIDNIYCVYDIEKSDKAIDIDVKSINEMAKSLNKDLKTGTPIFITE